jgi:hypothetical protein
VNKELAGGNGTGTSGVYQSSYALNTVCMVLLESWFSLVKAGRFEDL